MIMKIMRILLTAMMSIIVLLPQIARAATEGTINGEINLFLFENGTGSDNSGNANIRAQLGDIITIDVYARNPNQVPVAGIEIYLTVDDRYFDIVPQGYNIEDDEFNGQPKPFIQGDYLKGSQGVVQRFGNNTFGDSLTARDNAIDGWQLNYVEITGTGGGGTRPVSRLPYGVIATFQLRAKAVCESVPIKIDVDQYYLRMTRYIDPYASYTYYFKTMNTCKISVSGVRIDPPLPDFILAPGESISSLDLDDHIDISSVADSLLKWEATGQNNIGVTIDPATRRVTFQAPVTYRGYEDITFKVTDDKKTITASDILRVTVDSAPFFNNSIPDTLFVHEDSLETVLYLPTCITDNDDPYGSLTITALPGPNLSYAIVADSLKLKGALNFNGRDTITLRVNDSLALADTVTVPVVVRPVNDKPTMAKLPNVTVQRNASVMVDLNNYASDIDGDKLIFTWSAANNIIIQESAGKVTIRSKADFIGSEEISFTATDPGGLSASETMKITVTPSAKPPVWTKFPKIGFAQGRADSSLVLWNYVSDPDDPDSLLTFEITNFDDVDYFEVNEHNGKLILYDIDQKAGWDRLTITAYDPDGNFASTECVVFIAPADGTPIVGGIPDTTIVAGTQSVWIDLDNYYYDIDNTDSQMKWTWGRMAVADSAATFSINPSTHEVRIKSIAVDRYGEDRIYFTVTDPTGKYGDDICSVTVLKDLSKPVLNLPTKIGFITGSSDSLDLDYYVSDALYKKSELSWNWSGNTKVAVTKNTPTTLRTNPVTFSGQSGWIGWERIAFIVANPLSGSAADTLLVFSAPADGTPVAGGLGTIGLKAGNCTSVFLDDYFYDADSPDYTVQWSVSGADSLTVTIDPLSHIAQICAHSLTWQGQVTLNFTVTDPGGKSAAMQVPVIVTDAQLKNVLSARIFRNPMQEDYMEMFVTAKMGLTGIPTMTVKIGTDSTRVTLTSVQTSYYRGKYVLPLAKSVGIKGIATIIMAGNTTEGRAVQDTTRFGYGYLNGGGGKIALGKIAFDIKNGALNYPAWLIVTETSDEENGVGKPSSLEIEFDTIEYCLDAGAHDIEKPVTVSFETGGKNTGAGVFMKSSTGGLICIGAIHSGTTVSAESKTDGVFRLGYDNHAPQIGTVAIDGDLITVPLYESGSGIDRTSITVETENNDLSWRFDSETGMLYIAPGQYEKPENIMITVGVSDITGNRAEKTVAVNAANIPGLIFIEQNTPNPFNPETFIPFTLTSETQVSVVVYDLLGRRVCVLADSRFAAGHHALRWDARDDGGRTVSSGVYMYRIDAGGRSFTRKMLFLR